jgi:CHAT domain-containing protein
MSHLVEQLLNAQNIPLLSFMNHNLNLIDQVPMPELLQENTDYNLNKYSHKYAPKRGITPKFNRQYQPDIYSKEYNSNIFLFNFLIILL